MRGLILLLAGCAKAPAPGDVVEDTWWCIDGYENPVKLQSDSDYADGGLFLVECGRGYVADCSETDGVYTCEEYAFWIECYEDNCYVHINGFTIDAHQCLCP